MENILEKFRRETSVITKDGVLIMEDEYGEIEMVRLKKNK